MSKLSKTPVPRLGMVVGSRLALGLALVFGLAASAFCQSDSSARRIHFTDVNVRSNDNSGHHTIMLRAEDDNGNTYRMRKVDDKIVDLEVNDKPASSAQFDRYADLLERLMTPPVPPVPPVAPTAPMAPGGLAAPVAPGAPAAPVAPGMLAAPVAPAAPAVPGSLVAPAAPANPSAPAMPLATPVTPLPPASPLPPTPPAPPEPPRGNKYVSRVIDELIDQGIISDDSKLSFSLDNSRLTVNQVAQPDSVFQLFKKKYIKHPGDHMSYEHSGSSTISNIKIDDDNH